MNIQYAGQVCTVQCAVITTCGVTDGHISSVGRTDVHISYICALNEHLEHFWPFFYEVSVSPDGQSSHHAIWSKGDIVHSTGKVAIDCGIGMIGWVITGGRL